MAWWTLKYACGHGEHDVQLYGKRKDRESKAAWYEANVVCPDCYKKQCREKEANAPKELYGNYRSPLVFVVTAKGDRDNNKDALKEIGFKWHSNFATESWSLDYSIPFRSLEELKERYEALLKKVEPLGYKPYKDKPFAGLGAYDLSWIEADLEQYNDYQKVKASIPPAPDDSCFDFMRERHGDDFRRWNGKIYGRAGGYNYYVNNVRYSLTDEQKDAIDAYRKEKEAWLEKKNSNPDVKNLSAFASRLPKDFEKWADAVNKIEEQLEVL